MKSTKPRTHAKSNTKPAPQDKAGDRSPAATSGGAPAGEEDIGTEGAGTEPREGADVARDSGSSPRNTRDDKDAP